MKLVYQYMAIFFTCSPTSNHLHSLQGENCDCNSRLVVYEDGNGKFRLERVNGIENVDISILKNRFIWIYITNWTKLKYMKKLSTKSKALKKTKLLYFQVVYYCANNTVCSIQHFIPQIPIVSYRRIQGTSKGTDVHWCEKARNWGIPLQHRLSAERGAYGMNIWPNAVITFNHP